MRAAERTRLSVISVLLVLFACSSGGSALAQEVRYESLTDIADENRNVDMLWWPPDEGGGPWPAILFVHGFQPAESDGVAPPGAKAMLETPPRYPLFGIYRNKGFLVAAVSQAGYGGTDGPLDFCGPLSQQAIAAALAALRSNPAVRNDQLFLHGRSRGAVASSMAATRELGVAGVILESGVYDMKLAYENLLREGSELHLGIAENIEREAGVSNEAFEARSVLLTDLTIAVPVLVLHGIDDARAPVGQAIRLEHHLAQRGSDVVLEAFRGAGHHIPVPSAEAAIDAFIARVVGTSRPRGR